MKVTKELNKPWCVSVFKDNSGVIRFDEKFNVCFKVETADFGNQSPEFGQHTKMCCSLEILGTVAPEVDKVNSPFLCFITYC